MDDEKLIELVRKYEFLYNLQHPKYMDGLRKEMAWKDIADQLKQPAAACKQRWQGLRDAYRRALNKKKGKSGQAAKKIKKWKYEDEMSFVASFFVEKKALESLELTSDEEDATPEVQNPDLNNDTNNNDAIDVPSPHDTEVRDHETIKPKTPPKNLAKKAKRVKAVAPVQTASAVLMSRLLDEQNTVPQQQHDDLDRFFLNISETVKKFSPYLQAVAKNKIFSLVSGMELQQLTPVTCPNTPGYPHTPSPGLYSGMQATTPMPTSPEPWNDGMPTFDLH